VRDATLAALLFLACIAPWTLRNWQAFHAFIPLRGNLGAELYMGNGPGSNGLLMEFDHPFQSPEQLRLYASLGEVRYVAQRGALAKAFIAAHPAHFCADVARRIYFFWAGVPPTKPGTTKLAAPSTSPSSPSPDSSASLSPFAAASPPLASSRGPSSCCPSPTI
jgi:hypothetical protein